jgi:hypothetical protein
VNSRKAWRLRSGGVVRSISLSLLLLLSALPASAARQRAVRHPSIPRTGIEHVFIVVLENTDASEAEKQPFIGRLISEGTHLRRYFALTHPSQPNYLAMTAGSLFGVDHGGPLLLRARHIGDLLEKKGLDWKAYAEEYPGDCSLVEDTPAGYARRHVPFLSYENIQKDKARCVAHVVNATTLDADIASGALPSYSLYIPTDFNNGHDTGVAAADRWLESRFGPLLNDERFTNRLLFILTFDEDASAIDNRVTTVLWGPSVKKGVVSDRYFDHYSMLRTVEDIFGAGSLGQHDAEARSFVDLLVP